MTLTNPLAILTMLLSCVALAHWLSDKPVGRIFGGAILVIIMVALLANLGVIPSASNAPPLYSQLISVGAPLSIFLLLLDVRLGALRQAGIPMIALFALGAVGTVTGITIAGWATGASVWLSEWYAPLSGMFTATYTGGGANFNALALHYDFFATGHLFAAATVVDHVVTVVWITALLALPRVLRRLLRLKAETYSDGRMDNPSAHAGEADQRPGLQDIATLLALGIGAHVLSVVFSQWVNTHGIAIPAIVILTTMALLAAQIPAIQHLRGKQILGMYGAYIFLGVLGAYCELSALIELGQVGFLLLLFVSLGVVIHGLIICTGGLLFKQSPEAIAVASTANIGGATVVLPMVQSFKRPDLLLPGILVGSLGNAIGTYLGFFLVRLLSG